MHALTGYLDFPADRRDETIAALAEVTRLSREDDGCVEYWWSEDLEHPNRFRFFECWESIEAFDAHQGQPYEQAFMNDHVSHIIGADAQVLAVAERRPVG